MSSDDQLRTAKAVLYQKIKNPVHTTGFKTRETLGKTTGVIESLPHSNSRVPNTKLQAFLRASICDTAARSIPYSQHTQSTDLAQRIGEWERQCPPNSDSFSMGGSRPWRLPQPIWAPAKFSQWPQCPPSPPLGSPSPPSRSLTPSLWRSLPRRSRTPSAQFKGLNLCPISGSPSPDSASTVAFRPQFIRKKPERDRLRPENQLSTLTTQLKEDRPTRDLAEVDSLRKQREDQEATEDFLRGILKKETPWEIFDSNFNFGPKLKEHESDRLPPLSPRSLCSSLPDLCPRIEHKSLKRQRHDSSTEDVATKSPRGRLHSISSPMPVRQLQPNPSAQIFLQRGFDTPEVHPGQLVNFNIPILPDAAPHMESDAYQMALDDRVRMLTCDLQRDPKVTRDCAFVCNDAMNRTTTANSSVSTSITSANSTTSTPTIRSYASSRTMRGERVRKRSYIPRCRSTDAFLRTVRESYEARMRMKSTEMGLVGEETLDPINSRC